MASYLPVLLVSVNANITPDDTVLVNAPRGQVDYLSHDWQEEDVWRSWRNMTRQKNEIQNGLRLENASWRTWWKQRNKLKTVSPETLNWSVPLLSLSVCLLFFRLKDSDVTWLYGPLHTAIDWSAPPKPAPVPDEVARINHLDFHETPCRPQPPPTKPILKHRSITELLSLKFPVFSPPESDIDDDDAVQSSTRSPKRPCLSHIKSDTHIIRWGASRAFRKDSPPRVPPSTCTSAAGAPGGVRASLSQDSASSASASGSTERPPKRKHISFNTFVEQCIAIDKHPRSIPTRSGFGFGDQFGHDGQREDGQREDGDDLKWVDDDGCVANLSHQSRSLTFNTSYEEDREDNLFDEDDPLRLAAHGDARPRRRHLNESAIHSDSDSDDGMIEIRPSSYRHPKLGTPCTKKKVPPRSKSASSSSSATTSTTASSTSSSAGFRQRRKSASAASDNISPSSLLSVPSQTSVYRPRPSHVDPPYRDRVTIAPIAPTFLKTTGAWDEGFGDEDGVSDDELWDYGVPQHGAGSRSGRSDRTHKKYNEEQSSDSTPVELVYVPPFGGVYDYGAQAYWRNRRAQAQGMEDEEDEMTEDVERLESQFAPIEEAVKINPQKEDSTPLIPQESTPPFTRSPIPAVIVNSSSDSELISARSFRNDCKSGSSTSTINVPFSPRKVQSREEDRGRSRGRSLSVSPIGGSSSGSRAPAPSSLGPSGGLLTSRGRSRSCQDLQSTYNVPVATTLIQSTERRGRSSSRRLSVGSNAAPIRGINSSRSSQSHSSGRSVSSYNSSTSPISDSISPDGGDARISCGIGSAYAGGRMGGRERESRFERSSSNSAVSCSRAMGGNERRGRDRGTRDLGSGSGSSVSPIAGAHVLEENRGRSGRSIRDRGQRPSPQAVLDSEPTPGYQPSSCGTMIAQGVADGNTHESSTSVEDGSLVNGVPKMEMDASICSVSSESSTATIVPTSNVVSPKPKIVGQVGASDNSLSLQSDMERQMQSDREALEEADKWRKEVPTPTPSNSPTLSMAAPIVPSGPAPATITIECTPKHVRTASSSSSQSMNSSSSSKYKPKSPPIVPSPSHPALPSTSSSHAPGEVGAISTGDCIRSASMSLERASSGSRERRSPSYSPVGSTSGGITTSYTGSRLRKEIAAPGRELERELAEARRGRCGSVNGGIAEIRMNGNGDSVKGALTEPTLLVDGGHKERETIINKAMGMVSNAYLKLWPGQTYSPGTGAGAAQ